MIKNIQRVSGAIEFHADENLSLQSMLGTVTDGTMLKLVNTHASNTITVTMPTGYTMNGQTSFTIAPDTILEFELIGKAWKCVSNKWEPLYTFESFATGLTVSFAQFKHLRYDLYSTGSALVASMSSEIPTSTVRLAFWENWGAVRYGGLGILIDSTNITGIAPMVWDGLPFVSLKIYGMK